MQIVASIAGTPVPLTPEYGRRFGPDWERRASHEYEYFKSLVPSLQSGGRRRGGLRSRTLVSPATKAARHVRGAHPGARTCPAPRDILN